MLVGNQWGARALQLGQRRKLVVRRISFPVETKGGLAEQRLDRRFEDTLAVCAVCHQQYPVPVQEVQRTVSPAVVVALFEERSIVGGSIKSPADTIAQLDGIVRGRRLSAE